MEHLAKKSRTGLNGCLIFGSPKTWNWLESERLWPEEWDIPTEKKEEIAKLTPKPILIPVVNTALRCFAPNEGLFSGKNRPIFVSNLLLGEKHYKFSREEKIAAVLHEIGHVRHDGKGGQEGEYLADNFVKECGFEMAMIAVLDRMIEVDKELQEEGAVSSYEQRKQNLLKR
jgi:hypothetical protein